ncbi:MAG TPA: NADP-dependent oxidoreductase, partial [Micropepsaceae bacterium]|nr:NADP-dependent oxidoreductase [Micropepsaceae bacterium]
MQRNLASRTKNAAKLRRDVRVKTHDPARRLPETMRAAAIDAFGGPDAVSLHTLPVPVPAADEVLIATHTAGVETWDAEIRDGWSPTGRRLHFPVVLGTEGSGTIVAVGARIRRFAVGDRVYGASYPKMDFHAEYVAVPAERVAQLPKGLSHEHGGVALAALTALQGIDDTLKLRRGDVIAVHGASGGVGLFAVQFAKLRGARVFASASGADGAAFVRRLGADKAVDGKSGDVEKAARSFAPEGFDAALFYAGGPAQKILLGLVRKGGCVAYPNGVEPAPKKRRGLSVKAYDGIIGVRELQRLNRAVEAAKLKVPIAAV